MDLFSRRVAAVVLALIFSGACATRARIPASPVPTPKPNAAAAIDALIERGCYTCLQQAYAAADADHDRVRTFETALLLVMRTKELGLPYERWLALAADTVPSGPDWADYLAIVRALRVDPLSGDRDEILVDTFKSRAPVAIVAGWRADLSTGEGPLLLRAYLELALACEYVPADRASASADALRQFGGVPLIEYRAGLCGSSQASHLDTVLAANPDFADVHLALGRYALDIPQQPDQDEALRHFTAARAAFPDSPTIVASLGSLRQDREEWADALDAYDATLRLVPTHRDALLGRVVTLSHLERYDEAIAAATRVLDLGTWFTGEAYYWRAWDEYHLAQIAGARADTDRAKQLMHDAPVLVLSGMIEWHERRLDASESELQNALTIDAGQCEAAFLLGNVRAEQRQWAAGAAAFELAQRCYDLSVTLRRETIARIAAGPGSASGKARLISRQERAMSEETQHRDEAAQNAVQMQRRSGV
jgi:tetratricopeptide (TPR) repeat protein